VYELDEPADLRQRLEAAGFSAHHEEVFMVWPLARARSVGYASEEPRIVQATASDYIPGSAFADLHGGAVLEAARGRGVYSRLLQVRVAHARERRCEYLSVDAAPMSRPILEAKGFTRICGTYPMRLKRP